jgi:hypothetical protein
MPASATAFHDNWDTDIAEVKVGSKFMYSDVNGYYLLEIVSVNVSDVTYKILRSKNNRYPASQVITIDDIETVVHTILKSKLQKTVNS